MAYFGNHSGIGFSEEDFSRSNGFSHMSFGVASGDSQMNMKNFSLQNGQVMPGCNYTSPLGFTGMQDSLYSKQAFQPYLVAAQYPYSAPYRHLEYQHLLAGVMEPDVTHCQSLGDALVPVAVKEEMTSRKAVTRSNKIRNKIQELHPFYSRRLVSAAPQEGRTRTRDKYRVVYTEKQRDGLEKAYKEDKFITMAKKAELSKTLALSDRQIKIWFQNRRAKERREDKRGEESVRSDIFPESQQPTSKPSCRFEQENVSPCSRTIQKDNSEFSVQSMASPVYGMTSPVYGMPSLDQFNVYESSASHSTNFKMAEPEAANCPEAAQTRLQMSPSEWMDAYHQPHLNTVNISPFTSSLDFSLRA